MRKILGWLLIVLFGANLIFSLFFTFGESFSSHIIPILLSVVMIIIGIMMIRHKKESSNEKARTPILH